MNLPKINLVIIGHKDHGKSTLIGRLLYDSNAIPEQKLQEIEAELKKTGDSDFRFAFLLDTLEEERRGGLTIDIMQTPFKTNKYLYTIIDCPGHREFIEKMLTGASQANAAILVISVKEGIQEQTKQHVFLAKTLGIHQLIVAINKMDGVNYEETKFRKICEELIPILNSLGYEKFPIIPISAMYGENVFKKSRKMPWYNGLSLIEALDKIVNSPEPPIDKPLRGCVQDIYEIEGKKIIACKILTGMLKKGENIIFTPSGEEGFVEKIEVFGKEVKKAGPGDSVGLIMNKLKKIKRGEVLSHPQNRAKIIRNFIAEVVLFSNIEIRENDILIIRCGTAEKKCRVEKILERIDPINLTVDAKFPKVLNSGDVGKILFSSLEPMCLEKYSEFPELGRFVIEGRKGAIAAGIVFEINYEENPNC